MDLKRGVLKYKCNTLIQSAITLLNQNLKAILFGVCLQAETFSGTKCMYVQKSWSHTQLFNLLFSWCLKLEYIIQYIEYFDFSIYKILSSRLFTEEEIEEIRNITLSDILLATKTLEKQHVPKDAFSIHNRMLLNY